MFSSFRLIPKRGLDLIHSVWLVCLISCFLPWRSFAFPSFVRFVHLLPSSSFLLYPLPLPNERRLTSFMLQQLEAILGRYKRIIFCVISEHSITFLYLFIPFYLSQFAIIPVPLNFLWKLISVVHWLHLL